ncbi:CxxH/CxxC protein [Metabacillus iocasae]|uniref:CxxH/CxxC protein (TIGR04129 family) n=1 Tax=Priestia iocasae TaxID=2291674 RepID=A0ABS2QYC4_9BACI|nr:CxxH/CxxC protein [Metabacillus iocasae]MBM7704193.1 CxxH/CxxC protein (TIGR04129 family) [Metabacillus iocasae]
MKIYCCEEHIELALDIVVDEIELAPVFEKIENEQQSSTCEYCSNEAIYVVGN